MEINRKWAMPNKETFRIHPIKELLSRHVPAGKNNWMDFFARDTHLAEFTNDINPKWKTDYHSDALTLAKTFADNEFSGCLLDWPFSLNQSKTLYNDLGKGHFCVRPDSMQYWSKFKHEVARITEVNGTVITFGWSSMGIGKNRGFEMIEVLIVPHGGSRNDTIITVERKIKL